MSKRRIWLVSLVVGALVATSGVAAATEHEDTEINFGYDEGNHILVFNTSPTDGAYICILETSPTNTDYTVSYVLDAEDVIQVAGLTSGSGEVMFQNRPAGEVGDDVTPAEGPGDYDTATDCQLQATEVTGPAGQVNHGMFMKALNSLYDGPRRGCVVRHFAGSLLGKDDQQILASDADPDFEPGDGESEFEGTVEFTSILSDCEREENGETAGQQGNGNGKGRPEWAGQGRPDSPGKSGSAPGRDR